MDVDYILIKAAGLPRIVVSPRAVVQTPATIDAQPQDQTVPEGVPVTFAVTARGNPTPTLQWLRNDIALPGATNSDYVIGAAALADSGARFSVIAQNVVSNATRSVTSSSALLTVLQDQTPPSLFGAQALGLAQVRVDFSERISPASATNLANYALAATTGRWRFPAPPWTIPRRMWF